MAKQKLKAANISASISASMYDGDGVLSFDCVGSDRCALAMFDVQPPEPDAECVMRRGFECAHRPAQIAALRELRDRITEELKQYEGPGEGA